MAVITRIDARSRQNNSIQIQDLDGNILCTIEAVSNLESTSDKARHEANLRLHASSNVQIVKGNGVVLRKK
jgi:hypothetical protein